MTPHRVVVLTQALEEIDRLPGHIGRHGQLPPNVLGLPALLPAVHR
jgi:hypothetical protein